MGPPAFAPNALKLLAPRPLRQAVRRQDLVDSLLGETAPLVLFSAPAGSGKTATISQWLEADERTSGWLQLDDGDNDPVTLLQYLARALLALTPLDPKVLMWLALPDPPIREAVLPALVKAVSSAPPFILVLDDAHLVRDPRCWEILGMLVEAVSHGFGRRRQRPSRSAAAPRAPALEGPARRVSLPATLLRSRGHSRSAGPPRVRAGGLRGRGAGARDGGLAGGRVPRRARVEGE